MTRIPEAILRKIEKNIQKIGADLREFPETKDGNYLRNRENAKKIGHIFNWTQSFFTGMALWAYLDTGKPEYIDWAKEFRKSYADKVFKTPMETMHDLGFLYSPYAVMLYRITGDEAWKEIGVKAADTLAMRFEPKGGYIRAWGRMDDTVPDYVDEELAKNHFFTESRGLAIIDSMMNIPLLFWASETTGHPFYKKIATVHADTVLRYFIRDDFSITHAYRFSEETGEPLGEANYDGGFVGSHWARGTAWAIYGFAIAYRYTEKEEYLDVSLKLLDKFMKESGGEIPPWDFRLPDEAEKSIDTSAAAIALCGIIELQQHEKNPRFQEYKTLLRENLEKYIDYDENVMGILKEQNGRHVYASYGDYFLIESYMKEDTGNRYNVFVQGRQKNDSGFGRNAGNAVWSQQRCFPRGVW